MTEGESSGLQCQRSDKKSKWGYDLVIRSCTIQQILVTVLGTGNIEMSTMDSFLPSWNLYSKGGEAGDKQNSE